MHLWHVLDHLVIVCLKYFGFNVVKGQLKGLRHRFKELRLHWNDKLHHSCMLTLSQKKGTVSYQRKYRRRPPHSFPLSCHNVSSMRLVWAACYPGYKSLVQLVSSLTVFRQKCVCLTHEKKAPLITQCSLHSYHVMHFYFEYESRQIKL